MKKHRVVRVTGVVLLAVGVAAALATLLVRDQISRHSRNLFSPHPLRRLAALGYLAGHEASVDAVRLLRDFMAWERRPVLRRRAALIVERMEQRLASPSRVPDEVAG